MASWGSYVFELCRINANQGLTAEIDWNYTSWSRRCRKILIGLVVRGAKTVVVRGKNRILTRNRKKPEMTVPISLAYGVYDGDKFQVLEGSQINLVKPTNLEKYNKQRTELLSNGNIVLENGIYILKTTLEFNTPSGASDFVLGGSTNGWTEWKNKDGKTLDELYRK